jgi:AraC-like DNA-binding protein
MSIFMTQNLVARLRARLEETDKRSTLAGPAAGQHTRRMPASAVSHGHVLPSAATAAAVSALFVGEYDCDMPRVSIPHPEVHIAVRFGPSAAHGLDVHAMGVRQTAHRKLIRRGQRIVLARLRLGAHGAVLGVPASAMNGGIVSLEDLWGGAAARQLCDQLAEARSTLAAATLLENAIAARLASAQRPNSRTQLALESAALLQRDNVHSVAGKLGVSDRHLRRVFHESLGMSPKAFAKLARFHRALGAARESSAASWANVAAASGYYDQAHLIAEFRAITGVTPQVLLDELRAQPALD